jgi:hypothetical protein
MPRQTLTSGLNSSKENCKTTPKCFTQTPMPVTLYCLHRDKVNGQYGEKEKVSGEVREKVSLNPMPLRELTLIQMCRFKPCSRRCRKRRPQQHIRPSLMLVVHNRCQVPLVVSYDISELPGAVLLPPNYAPAVDIWLVSAGTRAPNNEPPPPTTRASGQVAKTAKSKCELHAMWSVVARAPWGLRPQPGYPPLGMYPRKHSLEFVVGVKKYAKKIVGVKPRSELWRRLAKSTIKWRGGSWRKRRA